MRVTSALLAVGVVLGSRNPAAAGNGPPRVLLCDSTSAAGGKFAHLIYLKDRRFRVHFKE